MTQEEKVTMVQTLLGEDAGAADSAVSAFLVQAKHDILNRLYPFGIPEDVEDVPMQYEMTQIKLARNYFLRLGAEGEDMHIENGIHRSYKSTNDEELLSEVVPYCKIV